MSKIAILTLAAAVLIGCVPVNPDGTQGQKGSLAWFSTATPEAKKAYYTEICIGYGFKLGTADMARCMQEEVRRVNASFDRFEDKYGAW